MFGTLALFIDGQNLYYTARALGFEIDFTRLLDEFHCRGSLLRAYYYTRVNEADLNSQRTFLDWLTYNGFTVREVAKNEVDEGDGRRKLKRSVGIDLAVDALQVARFIDTMFLFSGDGDFCRLVAAVQKAGVHVSVVSTLVVRPPMVADELRRCADSFLDLDRLRTTIARPKRSGQDETG